MVWLLCRLLDVRGGRRASARRRAMHTEVAHAEVFEIRTMCSRVAIAPVANVTLTEDAPAQTIALSVTSTEALTDLTWTFSARPAGRVTGRVFVEDSIAKVQFTPRRNATGPVIITLTATSREMSRATQRVNVLLLPVNDRPTLDLPSSATGVEDIGLTVPFTVSPGGGVDEANQALALSTRVDNRSLIRRVRVVGEGAHRTLEVEPRPNAHGSGTVTVVVLDDQGARRTASINVEFRPVNDPPVLTSRHFVRTTSDDLLRVRPVELLAGATDQDGDAIRAIGVRSDDPFVRIAETTSTDPKNPDAPLSRINPNFHAARITPEGGLQFQPALGFTGRVRLVIQATDGTALSEAIITIDVVGSGSDEPDMELVTSSAGGPNFGHAIAFQTSNLFQIGGGETIGRTGVSAFNRGLMLLGVGRDAGQLRVAEALWWDVWANPSDWREVIRSSQSMLDDGLGIVLIGSDDLGLIEWSNSRARSSESRIAADFFGIDLTQIEYRAPLILERWPSGATRMKIGAAETAIRMTIQAPVGERLIDIGAARDAAAELRSLPSTAQELAGARVRAELTRLFGGDGDIIYRVADEALNRISWPRLLIDAGHVSGNSLTQRLGAAIATSPLASLVGRELIAAGQTAEFVAGLLGAALLERIASGTASPNRLAPWPQDLLFPAGQPTLSTTATGSQPPLTTPDLVSAALDAGWRSRLVNATSGLKPIAAQIPGLERVVDEIESGEPLTDWELVATVLNTTNFLERLRNVATRAGLPQPAGVILNLASGFTNEAVSSFVQQVSTQSQKLPYSVRIDIARTLREGVSNYLSSGFISAAYASEEVPVAPDRANELPWFFDKLGRVNFVPETRPAPSGGEDTPGGTPPAPTKDGSFATLLMATASEVISERAAGIVLDAVPDEFQSIVGPLITPIITEKVNQFAFQVISSAANGLQLPGLINNAYGALGNFTNSFARVTGLSNVPSGVFQAASIIANAAGAPVEVSSGISIVAALSTGNPVAIAASIVQSVVDINAHRRAIKAANRAVDIQYNREIAAAIGNHALRYLNPVSESTREFIHKVDLEIEKEDQDHGRLGNEFLGTLVQQWTDRESSPPVEIPLPVSGSCLAPDQYGSNMAFGALANAVEDVLEITESFGLYRAAYGRVPGTPAEQAAAVALGASLVALRQSLSSENSNPDPEDECDCLMSRDEWKEASQWTAQVFFVDPRSNSPEAIEGLEHGIYPYYAKIFLEHPELHWAGIAAYVGKQNVNAVHVLDQVRSGGVDLINTLNKLLNPAPTPLNNAGLDILTSFSNALLNAGVKPLQTIMVSMGYEIFDDIGWVLEAYRTGGLSELECLVEHGELSHDVYQAFVAFNDGRYIEGSVALAQYEQLTVANPVIRNWRISYPVHAILVENSVSAFVISGLMVGDLGLGKYRIQLPPLRGNFFDTDDTPSENDRFQFARQVVSAFSDQISDSERRLIVKMM